MTLSLSARVSLSVDVCFCLSLPPCRSLWDYVKILCYIIYIWKALEIYVAYIQKMAVRYLNYSGDCIQ